MLALLLLLTAPLKAESLIVVDTAVRKPISPYIYGVNFPNWDKMGIGFPLARQGGNRMTAYNWETNASNAGADWHHQNDALMGETNESGFASRTYMDDAQKHGAAVLLTIPTAGYVAADKKGDGDVNQTPDYINVRFLKSYAKKSGPLVYPPDTKDKAVYQDELVAFLEKKKSPATPVWYSLDNEPDLWGHTHQRIWPKNPTYAQIIANNIDFGSAIKGVAPKTLVFGPANYGWMGFRTFQGAPDAAGRDFLDVYLAAMRDAEKKAGKRILDVLDIHWYPEARGDDVRICDGPDKPGTPAARIQAPRSLWDKTYVEQSWIAQSLGNKPIALLPGIFGQIDRGYPGTKLAITEYNYGGGKVISGTIAQADVLGIYGRYGLFAACNWGVGADDIAELAGFRAFLDYDGKGSKFGDQGLAVAGETAAEDSVYAALKGKVLTLLVINKTKAPRPYRISLKGFQPKAAQGFTYTADSLKQAKPTPAQAGGTGVTLTVPPESVTTIEVR